MLVESQAVELLGELRDTLLLEEDCHYPLLLEFHDDWEFQSLFGLLEEAGRYTTSGQIAVVVGSFVTAYLLLDEGLLKHSIGTLDIQMSQSINFRFDLILIGDLEWEKSGIKQCYIPEARFHNQIEHFLRMRLHEAAPRWEVKSWPSVLNCCHTDLSPIDSSKASSYIIQRLKETGFYLE
ncbi:hypothetical protein CEK25_007983 [Fusarium fujikuroi]|nr:hypothetical protein CEK25_007983 [Fusarium fujikuroi]